MTKRVSLKVEALDYYSTVAIISVYNTLNNALNMRVGILGSACDPPHKAHIKMAEVAQKELKLDRVIIIPTKVPPHKDLPLVPQGMRLKMAKLAVGGRKNWIVSDMELKRKGKSYTRDTIHDLKKFYPKDKIFWIVGSDAIVSMPWKWKGGWGILDLCKFVVFPRLGYSLKKVPKNILKKVIVLKPITRNLEEISSTKIRDMFKKKKSSLKYIDRKVYGFIKKYKLYMTQL